METADGGARPAEENKKVSAGKAGTGRRTKLVDGRSCRGLVSVSSTPARDCGGKATAAAACRAAAVQRVFESLNTPGKAVGSAREKLPWPSFRSIATGCLNHAVV